MYKAAHGFSNSKISTSMYYSTAIEIFLFGPYLVSNTGCVYLVLRTYSFALSFSEVNFQAKQTNAHLFQNACVDQFSLQFWHVFNCIHVVNCFMDF